MYIPIELYLYCSPDYKTTNLHYRKTFLTKKIIQVMLNIFYILSEIIRLFSGRRVDPPPLIEDMSAKKSSFTPS